MGLPRLVLPPMEETIHRQLYNRLGRTRPDRQDHTNKLYAIPLSIWTMQDRTRLAGLSDRTGMTGPTDWTTGLMDTEVDKLTECMRNTRERQQANSCKDIIGRRVLLLGECR